MERLATDFLRNAYEARIDESKGITKTLMIASAELYDAFRDELPAVYREMEGTLPTGDRYLMFKAGQVFRSSPSHEWAVDIHIVD